MELPCHAVEVEGGRVVEGGGKGEGEGEGERKRVREKCVWGGGRRDREWREHTMLLWYIVCERECLCMFVSKNPHEQHNS